MRIVHKGHASYDQSFPVLPSEQSTFPCPTLARERRRQKIMVAVVAPMGRLPILKPHALAAATYISTTCSRTYVESSRRRNSLTSSRTLLIRATDPIWHRDARMYLISIRIPILEGTPHGHVRPPYSDRPNLMAHPSPVNILRRARQDMLGEHCLAESRRDIGVLDRTKCDSHYCTHPMSHPPSPDPNEVFRGICLLDQSPRKSESGWA